MNWLDAILGVALLVCLVNGFRRGFSRQVIGLASGVFALLLGIWLYGPAGGWLLPYVSSPGIAQANRRRATSIPLLVDPWGAVAMNKAVAARVTALFLPMDGDRASICAGLERSPATSLEITAS